MNGTLDLQRPWDFHLGQELLAAIVARDESVAQHDDTARVRGDIGFVRHHDHRLTFGGETLEHSHDLFGGRRVEVSGRLVGDRKSTRLNSSHGYISYAVFCLKKKNKNYCLISVVSQ